VRVFFLSSFLLADSFTVVEVDDEDRATHSFDSDETITTDDQSPETSSTRYKRAANHPTQLFQFPPPPPERAPPPPAYSAPPHPTSHLAPIATGSTSELFKCVIKKPDVTELEINGELQSNIYDVRQQFLAELRVYRTVSRHRNIVAFLGCLEGLGMVLEYVDGSPLLDVIRKPAPPLERETKVDFHNQLLSGLAHIHSFGLSHGDLSLLNVHVTQKYQILKILDFGRSTANRTYNPPPLMHQSSFALPMKRTRSHSSNPSTPTMLSHSHIQPLSKIIPEEEQEAFEPEEIHPGTRPFTAPEILRGECKDAILADAYSFGMILLCLDLNNLVDVLPEHQKNDGEIDTTGCTVFTQRIRWYTTPWRSRRTVRKEDRIR
jgi:serine/threonine protein kinase